MFELDTGSSKLTIKIINYIPKEQRALNNELPNWAGFYVKVKTPIVTFESAISDVMSAEIDMLKTELNEFLSGNMKEVKYYEPIEGPFNIVMYPKGRHYGNYYDNKGNILILKEMELSIRIPDDNYLSEASIKFVLDERECNRFLNYLNNLVNTKYDPSYDEDKDKN